VQRGKAQLL